MLTISTESFAGYDLDHTFAIAKEAGLDGIEVAIERGKFDSYDAEYLKGLSERHDLPITAISTPNNLSPAKAEKAIELALEVGASVVTIFPPDLFDTKYKKWIRQELKILRKKKKVHVALVNAPSQMILGILPRYSLNDVAELKEFPDIALDTSNVASKSEPLLELYSALKQNIVHVYISNAKGDDKNLLLDKGNLPLESLLTRLARDKFEGSICLRLNPKSIGVGKKDKILENIERCKKFIDKYLQVN